MEDSRLQQDRSDVSAMTIVSLIIANVFVIATLLIPMALYMAIQ